MPGEDDASGIRDTDFQMTECIRGRAVPHCPVRHAIVLRTLIRKTTIQNLKSEYANEKSSGLPVGG